MDYGLITNFVIIAAGLFFVGKSATIVIDKATHIARTLKIREFIIGFVLLAIATSLPELAVAIISIVKRDTAMTIGNLIASSISNIGVLVALGAILTTIYIHKKEFTELAMILFFTAAIPSVLIFMPQFSFIVGILLLIFFGIYSWRAITKKETLEEHKRHHEQVKKKKLDSKFFISIAWFVGAIIVLMLAATVVVNSASAVATSLGVPKALIGATIVTIGTLLPEIAVTIQGLRSRRHSMVIGNAVGSAMTNIGLVLGLVLITSPFAINPMTYVALTIFLLGFNAMLWVLIKDKKIDRIEGIIMLIFYAMYMFMLIVNSL